MTTQKNKENKSNFSYKDTLNLLKTDFSMRANSVLREPEIQKFWSENKIDLQLGSNNPGKVFTLHDGPPYANGALHMGHALNKVLKDLANLDIREKLLEASNLSGQAINISRTSLNHSISYPLTSLYKIPHGIACAFSVVSIIKKFYKKINKMPGGNLIIESGNILNTLNLNEDFENLFVQSFDSTDISKIVLMNSRVTNFEFEISSKDLNEIIQNSYNLYSSN